jgi:hypothetical protein
MILLDKHENWEVDDKSVRVDGNVLRLRNTIEIGLGFLFVQVQRAESVMHERFPPGQIMSFMIGSHPDGPPPHVLALIESTFHWYAVSACNYVRMTGWLRAKDIQDDDPGKCALSYIEEVIPQVKRYRDKVAAHLSSFDPKTSGQNQDNPADLIGAPLPLGYCDGCYRTGALQVTTRQNGNVSESQHDLGWSLTETHRALAERYGWKIDSKDTEQP